MNDPISITVPIDVGRTSPNARLHHYERGRRNRAAKDAARLVWIGAGRPTLDCPVIVDVVIRRARALDGDNALAACKPVVDGIFNDGLTPADSPKWVTFGTVTQEVGCQHKGRESVEFLVRPANMGIDSER